MPNKPSAKKALRQTKKLTVLNTRRKRAYREAIKKTIKALEAGAREDAKKFAAEAQKALDKAAKHGTIKSNTAARKLSRLMKKVNAPAK
jgi:small subunit ribosomal protein S20